MEGCEVRDLQLTTDLIKLFDSQKGIEGNKLLEKKVSEDNVKELSVLLDL